MSRPKPTSPVQGHANESPAVPPRTDAPAQASPRPRRFGWFKVLALLQIAVLVAVSVAAAVVISNGSLLRWAVHQAQTATDGRLKIDSPSGSPLGELHVDRLSWADAGTTVRLDDVRLRLAWRGLLQGRLAGDRLSAARVEVVTTASDQPVALPSSLGLPVRIDVAQLAVDELLIRTEGEATGVRLHDLQAALRYDGQRWAADSLAVRSEAGALRGSLMLQDREPFSLEGQVLLETRLLEEPLSIDAHLSGTLQALDVRARTVLRDAGVAGTLAVTPFDRHLLSGVDLTLSALDLSRFDKTLPRTRLSGSLKAELPAAERGPGRPTASGTLGLPPLAGRLTLDNALEGTIDANRLPLRRLTATLGLTGDQLRVSASDAVGAAGRVAAQATLDLTQPQRSFDLRLTTDSLNARKLHTALVDTALQGSARIRPEGRALLLETDLADTVRSIALRSQARLQDDRLQIAQARVQAKEGTAELSGTMGMASPYALQLSGTLTRLDPSRLADVPAGLLNGPWQVSGKLLPAPDLQAQLTLADSTWRGQPLAGRLSGHYGPGERLTQLDADLKLGGTSLRAKGALGEPADRLEVSLQAARLQETDPKLAGQLSTQFLLGGALRSPTVSGRLTGRDLRVGEHLRVASVQLNGALPALDSLVAELRRAGIDVGLVGAPSVAQVGGSDPIMLNLQAQGLRWDERVAEQLTAELSGDAQRHVLSLSLQSRKESLNLRTRLEGGFVPTTPGQWQGRVLEATQVNAPMLKLLAPSPLTFNVNAPMAALGPAQFEIDGVQGAKLELERAAFEPPQVVAQGRVSGMPLRWVDRWVAERGVRTSGPDALRLGGRFDLTALLHAGSTPQLQGNVSLQRESGDVLVEVPATEAGVELLRAGLRELDARLDLQGGQALLQARVRGDALGSATVRAVAPVRPAADGSGLPALDVPLTGRIDLDVPSLAFTRALVGEAWQINGAVQAGLALGGTLQSPRISGSVSGRQLVAVQREFGMRLTDGELQATVVDNQLNVRTLRFASGKGSVSMSGSLRPDDRSEAVVTLSQMPIPLGAGQRLVVSGESRATFSAGVLRLTGSLRADEGVIEITSGGGPTVSSDVVVVRNAAESASRRSDSLRASTGRDDAARAARAAAGVSGAGDGTSSTADRGFRVTSNLAIDLGERFRVFGAGVDARLTGQVTLSGRLPDSPRLNGTVLIAQGTYTGFGQNLEIERGKLVFSGAVDNPAIDIVAYRRFLPVEAGVAISGTARLPRLTLVSKPDVPEPDKLSWLVLGMSAESSRGGQAAALQAAAALLAAGDPRAAASPSLASTVGLDVLSVRTGASGLGGAGSASASVQDTVITLGKRISERLFVSYEQSLRGLQNLLRLQYEISERLSIRARVGTENAIDLVWTKRYD